MNRFFKYLVIFFFAGILLSCEGDKHEKAFLEIAEPQLSFEQASGNKFITVSTNQTFKATSNQTWCVPSVMPGRIADNLMVTATKNDAIGLRTAILTVSTEGLPSVQVTVTQLGMEAVIVIDKEAEGITLNDEISEFTLHITTNVPISITLPEWIETKGSNNNTPVIGSKYYNYKAKVLTDAALREGDITIKATDVALNLTKTVHVKQNSTPLFSNALNFGWQHNTQTLTVKSGFDFSVHTDVPWCTATRVNSSIEISVTDNDGAERTTEIIVQFEGWEDVLILITQRAFTISLRIATYNTGSLTQSNPIHAWEIRGPLVYALIRSYDFDIFGQQEGTYAMLSNMIGTEYGYIGNGNTAQLAGQREAICYKKDKFTVLDKGDFWYSPTPDVPGTQGWDAKYLSKCTWGKFKEQATGREFYFFNSHFDASGSQTRLESAKLLLTRIKAIAGDYPVFCTGDFNAQPNSAPIAALLADGFLRSAYDISEARSGSTGTYNGFTSNNPTATNRIDYIMVTSSIRVKSYAVLNDRPNSQFPSDHDPVMVDVVF
jgi:endonuclease/exonuclease/phosphatase family metal-dependent hydrolase